MYREDLTPCPEVAPKQGPVTLNVGWLDAEHPFATGVLPASLLDALFSICEQRRTEVTRGYHPCPFCIQPSYGGVLVERFGRRLLLGGAEIRLPLPGGPVFAAPDLVLHYVADHGYLPPPQFVAALQYAGGGPGFLRRCLSFLARLRSPGSNVTGPARGGQATRTEAPADNQTTRAASAGPPRPRYRGT